MTFELGPFMLAAVGGGVAATLAAASKQHILHRVKLDLLYAEAAAYQPLQEYQLTVVCCTYQLPPLHR